MLTILARIATVAYVGALDSQALTTACAMHKGADPVLVATVRSAHAATEAALAVALAPFGVQPGDKVPGSDSTYTGPDGTVRSYSMDYATGARVYGSQLIGGAS